MKKLITLALTAALTLTSAFTSVQAAGRTEGIYKATSDNSEIHILYNDTIVQYEDVKPVNTDGRVMIPFRAALENMGASVDYDASQRLVTAKKGNITIKFTLMDDTIYIDKNGAQSTITMDVPMIIVNDRTLVPIRFMSNAFDMQVGWDGTTETVVIMDYDDYFANVETLTPNLTKAMQLKQPEFNNSEASFDLNVDFSDTAETFAFAMKGTAEGGETDAKLNAVINIESKDVNVKDSSAEIIVNGSLLYFKSDLLEQIAKTSDSAALKLASITFNGITWYKIDLDKLLPALGMPEMTTLLNGDMDLAQMLKSGISTEGDANFGDAVTLATMLDTYEEMDKYISVTEKENGGYTMTINITNDDFAKLLSTVMGSIADDMDIKDYVNSTVTEKIDADEKMQTTDILVDINASTEGMKLGVKLTMNGKSEFADKAAQVTAPTESVDITDTIMSLLK